MKKIHIVIIIIAVLALCALLLYKGHPEETEGSNSLDSSQAQNDKEAAAQAKEDIAALQSVPTAARYANAKYGFSFEKPEGYTVGVVRDDIGETILVQPSSVIASGSAAIQSGFQIYITPIDAPMTLTPNLIKSDLPGTSVNNPLEIVLGGNGSKGSPKGRGIMFSSNNSAFGGASYEIWLVVPSTEQRPTAEGGLGFGYLYQITSYQSFATELKKIIGTWKFQ